MPRCCLYCIYWSPPLTSDELAYEAYSLGYSNRRAKRPKGTCDHVLLEPGKIPSFSATAASFSCLNFLDKANR